MGASRALGNSSRARPALPFSITQASTIDRNKHTATAAGALDFYVETAAGYGYYKVSFRIPTANVGVP